LGDYNRRLTVGVKVGSPLSTREITQEYRVFPVSVAEAERVRVFSGYKE